MWARNFKKSRPKNLWNQIKSISRIIFFCNFKNGQKSIFELGKLPKMQFHEKKFLDLFDFTSFFAWTFLNYLAHCVVEIWIFFPSLVSTWNAISWVSNYIYYHLSKNFLIDSSENFYYIFIGPFMIYSEHMVAAK